MTSYNDNSQPYHQQKTAIANLPLVVVSNQAAAVALTAIGVKAIQSTNRSDPNLRGVTKYIIWPCPNETSWLAGFSVDNGNKADCTIVSAIAPQTWLSQRVRSPTDFLHLLDAWPPLLSLDTPKLPRIESNALPTWAGKFAHALTLATEIPSELAIANVLGACSLASARRAEIEIEPGYREPLNLWLICALPPANRKSAAMKSAFGPVINWEIVQREALASQIQATQSELETLEARARKLRKQAASTEDPEERRNLSEEIVDLENSFPEPIIAPTLWTSDSTPERLASLMAADADQSLGWISSEGGIFDTLGGRYSNGIPNLDNILKAWSQDAIRVNRGGRIDNVELPTMTVCLSPQPDVIRGLASKRGFSGRGLLGRFLYLLPPSPVGYRSLRRVAIADEIQDNYKRELTTMLNWQPNDNGRHTIKLSKTSYEEWKAFEAHFELLMQEGNQFYPMQDWAGKCVGQTARLAGVLHCIKHADSNPWLHPVDLETMTSAIKFMLAVSEHSIAAYRLMGKDEGHSNANKMWQWIVTQQRESFSLREAQQSLKHSIGNSVAIRTAANDLAERGYIHIHERTASKGRPPNPNCIVRPDFVASWQASSH